MLVFERMSASNWYNKGLARHLWPVIQKIQLMQKCGGDLSYEADFYRKNTHLR